jgi:hypothetical protein
MTSGSQPYGLMLSSHLHRVEARPAWESAVPEDSTEGAVVLGPNLGNNLIHGPVVQLLVTA